MKALIIDDSRVTRNILKGMVKEFGFESVEAADGKEAIEQLEANPDINVALVDWNMPVMDGYDFIKYVREDSNLDPLFLMMVTTETEMDQVIKALQAGANEYVMKPFTREIIHEKLKLLGLVEA